MPTKAESRESSFITLLSGWAQQGMQSFFAAQRVLVDLAMKQNATVMHSLRDRLTEPETSPTAILSEVTGEAVANFIEAQRILLDMGQKQNEILMTGVKERIGNFPAAHAAAELLQRSVDTFVDMQQELLKIAEKQNDAWSEAAKAGKPYKTEHLIDLAREAMEHFVNAQKHFMDVITEEMEKATSGKHTNGKKHTKTEMTAIARETTEAFIEAQKKLVDVAGKQMTAGVESAGKTLEILKPFPFLPLAELTREGVKSYVDVQKQLMTAMTKAGEHKPVHHIKPRAKRGPKRERREETATAASA
jgi:hypothetical protein